MEKVSRNVRNTGFSTLNSKFMSGTAENLSFNDSAVVSGNYGGISKQIGRFIWVSGYFKTSWYGDNGALCNLASTIPAPSLTTYFSCGAKGKPLITGYVNKGERYIYFNLESVSDGMVYFNFIYPID